MKPKIILRKIGSGSWDIKKQRAIARSLLVELTGKNVRHLQTGRPVLSQSIDVSISHKNDLVCVGIVPKPYKIGIDVEHFNTDLNAELFFGSVITEAECSFFKTFCESNNFSLSSGVAIFWSIKESFFKCLDYDLKPGKIKILNISNNGEIGIAYSDEIRHLMNKRKLKLDSMKVVFNKGYIYSQTIMKKESFLNNYPQFPFAHICF